MRTNNTHTQKEKRLLFFFHVVEPCIKPSKKVKKKKFLHRNRKMTTFISATTRYTKRSVSSSYLQCNNLRNFLLFILLARSSKSNNIFILLFCFVLFSLFKIRRHLVFLVSRSNNYIEMCACLI